MKNLPKSLMVFITKYGFGQFKLLVFLWAILLLCTDTLTGVVMPLVNKWFIAIFENPVPAGETLLSVAIPTILLITILYLSQTLGYTLRNVVVSRMFPKLRNHLSQVLVNYVNSQSMSFYTSRMPGKIDSQINYIAGAINIIEDFFKMGMALLIIVLNMGIILSINGWVSLILGLSLVFRIAYGAIFMKPMSKASKTASESSSSLSGKVIDSISNFSIVKLFTGAKNESKYLGAARKKAINDRIRAGFFQRVFWVPGGFLWDLLMGLTMFLCVKFYMSGDMMISDIVFTLTIYRMVMDLIDEIVNRLPNLVDVYGSAQQSYKELIKPIEIQDAPNAPDLKLGQGGIEIKNVSFSYGRKKVLDNLSLSIKPGEKVGLVGPSGAGKTTLVNMLMRFYDPKKGQILFDDQDIKTVTQDSLRGNITFIPQEPALFNRSLLENIGYARPDATLKEVRAAAKRAAADEFIMSTEKKYDSKVGDRGIKLSGGQKQRVAIARAFLKNAPILILDEATSALDSETEAVIQQSFDELSRGRTTIAIAHRLSTLRNMDRIVVIDRGKIIESGTHNALIRKKNGAYAKLWKMQSGGFLVEEKTEK